MVKLIEKPNAAPELVREVTGLLAGIEDAIIGYVYGNKRFAYRTVATNLRILLLDNNSARSWSRKTQLKGCLLELCFRASNGIFMRSFHEGQSPGSRSQIRTPLIYPQPISIIWYASQTSAPISLTDWLHGFLLVDVTGKKWNVRQTLKWMADKSGAHALNDKQDPRADLIVGFAPPNASHQELQQLLEESYGKGWEHFVIDAGMRLLSTRTNRQGQLAPMFRHGVPLPSENPGNPTRFAFTVEKRTKR